VSKKLPIQPHLRELLKTGLRHHKAGRTQSAKACYRKILRVDPHCAPAIHLLGLVALEAGRYQESAPLIRAALALDPDDPDTLNSLAESHLGQGELQLAIDCCRRVAELCPGSAEAHCRLGHVQEKNADWEAATDSYRRALALRPDSPQFHCDLARVLRERGALKEAVSLYERAAALNPNRHETYDELGLALTEQGELGAGLEALRHALALKPDSAKTIHSLGYFFERKGDLSSAEGAYRDALKLDPKMVSAHLQLGIVRFKLGDLTEALECFHRARALDPNSAEATFNLALVHLLEGNLSVGWNEYESRLRMSDGLRNRRRFPQPQWKGEPLGGAPILLYAEQGLGDTIQFVRYVPLVAARGGCVVLEVLPRLRRLLSGTEGAWRVITTGESPPEVSYQCPLLSLPLAFATDLSTIPATVPYIYPNPAQVDTWRERFFGNTLRIGLAWAGSPKHARDSWRSIPLAQLAPLLDIPGTTFYSLQMGPGAEQVKQMGPNARLIDLQDQQEDFADTAAIVANLDLVISVDTSVAHLAGAMGKPLWVILGNAPDWRWFLDREDSPWYPTARLFRQSTHGSWQDLVDRLERELRQPAASMRVGGRSGHMERRDA
jgi:tetratricopeptide (TPR) repeat protein